MAAIQESDLIVRFSEVRNDTATNGGRMIATPVGTGIISKLFYPPLSRDQRTAGITRYRKIFLHISTALNETLFNIYHFMLHNTREVDRLSVAVGTQDDTQASLPTRWYGVGALDSNVLTGASSIDVLVEDVTDNLFQAGDAITIFHVTWNSGTSTWDTVTYERHEIDTISNVGNLYTIGLVDTLQNDFDATEIWNTATPAQLIEFVGVASMIPYTDTKATSSALTITSAGGTYDDTTYPIELVNLSTVLQNWTITFTSTTAFTITGDTLGLLPGGGNTTSDTSPNNPDFTQPYWTLRSAGFGGSWLAGDTIELPTFPAAIPIWMKQVVPAATDSFTDNRFSVRFDGESE